MQSKPELIFELLGKAPALKSMKNRPHDAGALGLGQTTMLESPCDHRPGATMPYSCCLRLEEGDALLEGGALRRKQSIAQDVQLPFVERRES